MDSLKGQSAAAKSALWITFALSALLNLADALWDPCGVLWITVRIAASVLFGACLVAFAVTQLRLRKQRSGKIEKG
jgi:hypothetical protein